MADFSTAFGSAGGNTRLPTTDERQNGFPCGPADRSLFNGLFRRIEEELQAVVDAAGLSGSNTDNTIVKQAILALIEAATGGGAVENYVLMTQARARLPFYPEVLNNDGVIGVTSPTVGQIRIPAGVAFRHRGIFDVTTEETDFATLPNKTYHLRWNPTDGFDLYDVADVAYNPSVVAETSAIFDTGYDNMFSSRIVTNSSNVASITNLVNKTRMVHQSVWRGVLEHNLTWVARTGTAVTLNWARTPTFAQVSLSGTRSNQTGPDGSLTPGTAGTQRALEVRMPSAGATRYQIPNFEYNYEDDTQTNSMADVNILAMVI